MKALFTSLTHHNWLIYQQPKLIFIFQRRFAGQICMWFFRRGGADAILHLNQASK
ncbi:hypothetical protein [Pseudomonas sp.]|uniref:hypothetical protein n=1 Tax=Pseudomonas sp. TaxID=306 RepID=UPI0025EFB2F0|nr:hypothetical protein [Pseudomonas sp.]